MAADWREAVLHACLLCGRAEGSRVHLVEKVRTGLLSATVGYRRAAICAGCLARAPVAVGRRVRQCWDVLPAAPRATEHRREPRAELNERDAGAWSFVVYGARVRWQE